MKIIHQEKIPIIFQRVPMTEKKKHCCQGNIFVENPKQDLDWVAFRQKQVINLTTRNSGYKEANDLSEQMYGIKTN